VSDTEPDVPRVALVAHSDSGRHDTGWEHPEHVGRIRAVLRAVGRDPALFQALHHVEAPHATVEDLALAHAPAYVDRVRAAAEQAAAARTLSRLDADTIVSEGSWDAATAGAGAALEAVDLVLAGTVRRAFAAVRPARAPRAARLGHGLLSVRQRRPRGASRARPARARSRARSRLGRAPRQRHAGARRAHARDPLRVDASVAVVSGHRRRRRSRAAPERVERAHARGPPGATLRRALERAVDAATRAWVPDLVLLSAGFDSLAGDPLGGFTLELDDVDRLTRAMTARADAWCGGRLVSALEGGYAPERLGEAAVAHLRALG
jgi:acetoin utilization deacetylase AcuC-like enzyme